MTGFTDIFIKRPVFASVLSLILLLLGLRAFQQLPLRQFPMIDTSVINVTTAYSGASPELMESYITGPIESSLNGISGIDYIVSKSSQGKSSITIQFELGSDINKANTDVSNAVSSVRYQLPTGIDDPVIRKDDPNANPIVFFAFSSTFMPEVAIGDYLKRVIKPQLSILPDVGNVQIWSQMYAMRIWLDPLKMAARGVSADDIEHTLVVNNVQSAAGLLEAPYQELTMVANTAIQTPQQFEHLVLRATDKGDLVRLSDVGTAELGSDSYRVSSKVNGQTSSIIAITPTSNGNPLLIAKELMQLLPTIQQHLPKGIHATLLWDASKFIKSSLEEVLMTIGIAAVAVLAVIFLFLGSWRAVLIPIITIPLSLLGVSAIMLALGYSLNSLTFLAWVLAIGLVVDDAIVVLENCYRHMEAGLTALQAAMLGAREIAFAVIVMTITLAAVYAPIGMMSGMTGILFREFAFTLASAVLISGFIALTLSPMMCSKLLTVHTSGSFSTRIDHFFERVSACYQKYLTLLLKHAVWVVLFALVIYGCGAWLFVTIPAELAPNEDEGIIMSMVRGPTSANLAYTEKNTAALAKIFNSVPERDNYGIINGYPSGVNTAISFLILKPWHERHRSAQEVITSLLPQMMALPGVLAFPFNPPPLPGSAGNNPVDFVLKTMGSYESLEQAASTLMSAAKLNPGLVNIDSDLQVDQLELKVNIDRDKANSLGISMDSIGTTLNLLFGEPTSGYFEMNGESYEIIPQLLLEFRHNPDQLLQLPMKTGNNQIVPLGDIVSTEQSVTPQVLPHFQQQRAVRISAGLAPGYTLGQALTSLQHIVTTKLSSDFQIDYADQSRQFMQSQGAMGQTFIYALIFIYLVLAAQFESFRNPLVVMLSVPLSLFGALLAMHLTHCTMNIYTAIGLITLIGLITKHGILIVEFTEQRRHHEGLPVLDALLGACTIRLRPILMTTAAMVLGAVPLILAAGAGAESRRQLGWVIVAGMGIGTCFTLFIIPSAYLLIANKKRPLYESVAT